MSKSYQLKITIKNSKPPIWRRVLIPDGITFRDLDDIIEEIFGWEHEHMFEFCFDREMYFTGSPILQSNDTVDEQIDPWLSENESFTYIYDFGDNWIHTIKVEKILEREERFPKVIKSKGPYLIEDCGGIWGFYDCIEEAQPFDKEEANEHLFQLVYPETVFENSTESNLKESDDIHSELENRVRSSVPTPLSLADVFINYSKDELCQIARLHHFTRYSKFKKADLAEWLKNSLLETSYMKKILSRVTSEELLIFDQAIQKNGIMIPQQLLETSLLLCSYAGFYSDWEFLQVPVDVQEKYKKICTPEFRRKLQERQELQCYCRAAVYLYGVVSKEDLQEIYLHYENKTAPENLLEDILFSLCQTEEGEFIFKDNLLMDERLLEQNAYRTVRKIQKDFSRYFPEDKEYMLSYGKMQNQLFTEETRFFIDYLEKRFHLEKPEVLELYMHTVEMLRMHQEDENIFDLYLDFGCRINSQKKTKEFLDNIKKLLHFVRTWELNGHTENEVFSKKYLKTVSGNKIIPFSKEKKIYPNDLCPCGSGKKYKHCCGKKQS